MFKRPPDFIIGRPDDPYLLRWRLIPRNRFFNIYLHRFLRDDDDQALHDHPWASVSFSSNDYFEWVGDEDTHALHAGYRRKRFRPVFRKATHRHRIVLFKDAERKPIPFWTILITGPNKREWGFWCPKGFVHWKDFVNQTDNGNVGRGCS